MVRRGGVWHTVGGGGPAPRSRQVFATKVFGMARDVTTLTRPRRALGWCITLSASEREIWCRKVAPRLLQQCEIGDCKSVGSAYEGSNRTSDVLGGCGHAERNWRRPDPRHS